MSRRIVSLLLLALVTMTAASCRVDVAVHLDVAQNGSGTVAVRVVADPAVVAAAPGLAEDVRVDDLRQRGWQVDGPTPTADGGLQLSLVHPFSTPEEATALLASVNGPDGPLRTIALGRVATDDAVTITLNGSLGVEGGLLAFTDPDLLTALGVSPYGAEIAAAGVDPAQAVDIQFSAALPGEVVATSGQLGSAAALAPPSTPGTPTPGTPTTGTPDTAGAGVGAVGFRDVVTWQVPLDGTRIDVATVAEESLRRGPLWSLLSVVALVVLVAWVIAATVVIGLVVRTRRRRSGRRPPHGATPPA